MLFVTILQKSITGCQSLTKGGGLFVHHVSLPHRGHIRYVNSTVDPSRPSGIK
jgi:hypothetical protein